MLPLPQTFAVRRRFSDAQPAAGHSADKAGAQQEQAGLHSALRAADMRTAEVHCAHALGSAAERCERRGLGRPGPRAHGSLSGPAASGLGLEQVRERGCAGDGGAAVGVLRPDGAAAGR
eukprot:798591-Rhodomonas_salina.1